MSLHYEFTFCLYVVEPTQAIASVAIAWPQSARVRAMTVTIPLENLRRSTGQHDLHPGAINVLSGQDDGGAAAA
jgi:hypothetical protein